MRTKITFEEMAKLGKEILDRQGPVTYEKAKEQVDRLRKGSYLRAMTIQEQAEKLANQYSHLTLKTFYTELGRGEGLPQGEREILEAALEIHRKRLRDKLNELNDASLAH